MPSAIQLSSVSKLYRLGTVGTGTLSHDLNRWWHAIRGKEDPYTRIGQVNDRENSSTTASAVATSNTKQKRPSWKLPKNNFLSRSPDYVWALRDINLEIEQGEIVGVIGRNGAGKSTLLKLLSRVTAPTEGTIKSRGRIASLLEVGTGFHPELTGRENIYMNGALLGMRRHEITRHLDEIIEFSGCAKYIDTPVKRYSSGMTVRLGFAVAAHLNCEILIVDEVLAVGDADFQKKCLGKMRTMHQSGRTVLIVSHQMSMITSLCDRGVVLRRGSVSFDGRVDEAVLHYASSSDSHGTSGLKTNFSDREVGDHRARLIRAWTEDSQGTVRRTFQLDEAFLVRMEYDVLSESMPWPYANFHLFDSRGEYVFVTSGSGYPVAGKTAKAGRYIATCEIPPNLLNTGTFTIGVAATCIDRGTHVSFWEKDALQIQIIEDINETIDQGRNGYAGLIPGPVRPKLRWTITESHTAPLKST